MKIEDKITAKILWGHCCLLFFIGITNLGIAQNTFFRVYGGSGNDNAKAVQQTPDGGYVVTGETYSFGAGSKDVYLFRTDSLGNETWAKTYGGNGEDYALTLDQTFDNALMIGAHTSSFGQGGHDHYLVKTDMNGDTIFTMVYGGSSPDGIYQLREGAGGYVMAGHTSSFGAGLHDFYVIKILANGDTIWTRAFGGTGADNLRGYVNIELPAIPKLAFIGETNGFGVGANDILLIKTDMGGNIELTKTYGNSGDDYGYSIIENGDGGFLIAGHTNSSGAGLHDVYLVKVDFFGNVQWSKTYGGTEDDYAYSAQKTSDGGYIIAGSTTSFGGGDKDVYLIKTDINGDTLWTKAYGESGSEETWSVEETKDGGYIIAGITNSFGQGNDALLIKTDRNGNTSCHSYNTTTIIDTAITIVGTPAVQTAYGSVKGNTSTSLTSFISTETSCPVVGMNETDNLNEFIKVFPNPSNGNGTLEYYLLRQSNVEIRIYNLEGKLIRSFKEGVKQEGSHRLSLPTKEFGQGIYVVKIKTELVENFVKLIIMKQ